MTRYDKTRAIRLVKSKFVNSPEYGVDFYRVAPEDKQEWYLARTPCWIDRYVFGSSVTSDGETEQVYHYADSNRVKTPFFAWNEQTYLERLANKLNYGR